MYVEPSLAFFDDGRLLVTPPSITVPDDAALSIWDVATGKDIRNVPGLAPGQNHAFNSAAAFAVSSNGKRAAVRPARDKSIGVAVYDTVTWELLYRIPLDDDAATALDFSQDNRRLAIGTIKGSAKIVDCQAGTVIATLRIFGPSSDNFVGDLALSPDVTLLAVGASVSPDKNRLADPVRVHSVADGSLISSYRSAIPPIKRIS